MRVSCFPITTDDILVTYDKKITPKQQEFLRGLNFHEYPTIQELSSAKISNNSETAKEKESFNLYAYSWFDMEETKDGTFW